ncbi:hypothetical protein ABW21_db0203945 [Orbilia brochopaga]|nr:hypothetical protein ABW21_db0203945 [Drechslerella brochopaga]
MRSSKTPKLTVKAASTEEPSDIASNWVPPSLPMEIYTQIFSYLDWENHAACMQVCPQFRDILKIESLRRVRYGDLEVNKPGQATDNRKRMLYSYLLFQESQQYELIREPVSGSHLMRRREPKSYYTSSCSFQYSFADEKIVAATVGGPDPFTEFDLHPDELEPGGILADSLAINVPDDYDDDGGGSRSFDLTIDLKTDRRSSVGPSDRHRFTRWWGMHVPALWRMSFEEVIGLIARKIRRFSAFNDFEAMDMQFCVAMYDIIDVDTEQLVCVGKPKARMEVTVNLKSKPKDRD